MTNILFYLGLGTLLTHELDAMLNHEWRILPLIRTLPDDVGMTVFLALHVPVLAVLIALVASSDSRVRRLTRFGVAAFLVAHGLLHALFMRHPDYAFSSLTSEVLIFGGTALGAAFLLADFLARRAPGTPGHRRHRL